MDIQTLRKQRESSFSDITKALDKVSNNQNREDDRFWKPEKDKAGNASAVIRFLDKHQDDELPWVQVYSHGFQGPTGKWYIEESLFTIGKDCPVYELNKTLYDSGIDSQVDQAKKQKLRKNWISNILVISDPKHPENEGKVFLYKFGVKIFDKIKDAMRPTFEDEAPVKVFDYWEGANFKLRINLADGWPSYEKSVFDSPKPISSDDEKILEIVNKQYKLSEFLDPSKFKSYEDLKKKLEYVLNPTGQSKTAEAMVNSISIDDSVNSSSTIDTELINSKSSPPFDDDGDFDIDKFLDKELNS